MNCIACAYAEGCSKDKKLVMVALMGQTGVIVADAVAVGLGVGIHLATLSAPKRTKVLHGLCAKHSQILVEAQEGAED